MSHSTTVASGAVFAMLVVVLLIGAGPSRPLQSVSYSSDGQTWLPALPDSLFNKDIRWVPGDIRSSTFHVFNHTEEDGRVQLIIDSDDPAFGRALVVSIDGVESSPECVSLVVAAGEKRRVDATVGMTVDAGNETQKSTAGVDLVVQWDNQDTAPCLAAAGIGGRDQREGAQP
ncbi:putative uncharacterized protein [Rhodococcus sp. AW25M09]|uniref:hypothetical protein n=1 Tax=Rhodococcus sp. AW25M09 TaxID=1268303 RepID=UPI0002AC6CC1|nr:hypothetical protein [Rhodococcus sp. AW25M09]CCQ14924.1 putative uncharacterized protein [Rhodococcus sp. AW25M09]